jgi:hypothetical protein
MEIPGDIYPPSGGCLKTTMATLRRVRVWIPAPVSQYGTGFAGMTFPRMLVIVGLDPTIQAISDNLEFDRTPI